MTYTRPRYGSSQGFSRPRYASSRASRSNSRRIKSFDPRLLVRRADEQIQSESYIATNNFNDFAIDDRLKEVIKLKGYTTPTPIQDEAINPILEGRDVVGIANTGTGKTAAFLLPVIQKLIKNPREHVLIIAPTRELAVQIQQEFNSFTRFLNMFSILCIGGVGIRQQKDALYRGANVVVGTPGRLKDLFNQRAINFSNYHTIILDEVDRMLDMGFIRDVQFIISNLPENRQSLFFSATLSAKVLDIIHSFTKDPITISVKSQETTNNVDQDIIRTDGRNKVIVLKDLLRKEEFIKVLVFGRTKWGIEKLSRELEIDGFRVASLHGNKNQNQRQRALDEFKRSRVNVLLATDIASRGLDIPDVTHVINFDLPESYEDYVHRIGRTGRADKKGIALSFVD